MSKLRFPDFSGKRLPVSTNNFKFKFTYPSEFPEIPSLSHNPLLDSFIRGGWVKSEGIEAKTIQKCCDLNGMGWAIVSQIVGESSVQIIFSMESTFTITSTN